MRSAVKARAPAREPCCPERCMQGHKMEESPDAELVVAARTGDVDAFTVLVERYRPPRCGSRTGSRATRQRMRCRMRSSRPFASSTASGPTPRSGRGSSRSSPTRREPPPLARRAHRSSSGCASNPAARRRSSRRQPSSTSNAGVSLPLPRRPARPPSRGGRAALLRGAQRERDRRGAVVPGREPRNRGCRGRSISCGTHSARR